LESAADRTFLGGRACKRKEGATGAREARPMRQLSSTRPFSCRVILASPPGTTLVPAVRLASCSHSDCATRRGLSAPIRGVLLLPDTIAPVVAETARCKASVCKRLHHARRETATPQTRATGHPLSHVWGLLLRCQSIGTSCTEPWGDWAKLVKARRGSPWLAAESGANHPCRIGELSGLFPIAQSNFHFVVAH
jgi:hypothetical protein